MKMKEARSIPNKIPLLIDTNVLLRMQEYSGSKSDDSALIMALSKKYRPYICFQNLSEFWVVASKPLAQNGFGLPLDKVLSQALKFKGLFKVIPDSAEAIDLWLHLCAKHKVIGKKAHDVKLAAIAITNGVNTILTNNVKDFEKIEGIAVLDPREITE